MATRKEYRIKLITKEFLNSDTCYLGFSCPEIASFAIPGQFVNISAGTMFLKRPFGIASVDRANGIEIPLAAGQLFMLKGSRGRDRDALPALVF